MKVPRQCPFVHLVKIVLVKVCVWKWERLSGNMLKNARTVVVYIILFLYLSGKEYSWHEYDTVSFDFFIDCEYIIVIVY